jgi:hypothetical protein
MAVGAIIESGSTGAFTRAQQPKPKRNDVTVVLVEPQIPQNAGTATSSGCDLVLCGLLCSLRD